MSRHLVINKWHAGPSWLSYDREKNKNMASRPLWKELSKAVAPYFHEIILSISHCTFCCFVHLIITIHIIQFTLNTSLYFIPIRKSTFEWNRSHFISPHSAYCRDGLLCISALFSPLPSLHPVTPSPDQDILVPGRGHSSCCLPTPPCCSTTRAWSQHRFALLSLACRTYQWIFQFSSCLLYVFTLSYRWEMWWWGFEKKYF